jgi:ATP-dependent Lon protease
MIDVYPHLAAGAQNKDGPSAGVAMVRSPLFLSGFGAKLMVVGLVQVCAIVSPLTGKCVPLTTAMTGEVSITVSFAPALT